MGFPGSAPPEPSRCRLRQTAPSSRGSAARRGGAPPRTGRSRTSRDRSPTRPALLAPPPRQPSRGLAHVAEPGPVLRPHHHLVHRGSTRRVELAVGFLGTEAARDVDPIGGAALQALL